MSDERRAAPTAADDFLSGTSGQVYGVRATSRAIALDAAADLIALTQGQRRRLRRASAALPRRRVLVLAIERRDVPNVLAGRAGGADALAPRGASSSPARRARAASSRTSTRCSPSIPPRATTGCSCSTTTSCSRRGFLDVFLFLAERFELRLAQPAHRQRSHAAYRVTRRRPGSVVRETRVRRDRPGDRVSRGRPSPRCCRSRRLRYGWGLDAHWSAVARDHGWRIGVVDATPIRHGLRLIASSYDRSDALAEARAFLADRPYTPAAEAQRTLVTHHSWRTR